MPSLEEMDFTYASKHGSVLDKVSELKKGPLLRFMVGDKAYERIEGSPLAKELHDKVKQMKEKHVALQADKIAVRCFPKYIGCVGVTIDNYALTEPALTSFLNGVINYVVPKELLAVRERSKLVKFTVEHLLNWRPRNTLFDEEQDSLPMIQYAAIEKDIRPNLPRWWNVFNGDKHLADSLLSSIAENMSYFIVLYVLHHLRNQTRIHIRDSNVKFYYIKTYKEIIRCAPTLIDEADDTTSSLTAETRQSSSTSTSEAKKRSPAKRESATTSAENENRCGTVEEAVTPPLKRLKSEVGGEGNKSQLMFPRSRPPDDIPVYDYMRVKGEKIDPKFAQMEIESTVSNPSSNYASRSSSIDEWEDVLKSVDADQAVPEEYKLAFRCLVVSNRDLREHNRILRSQLEKGVNQLS